MCRIAGIFNPGSPNLKADIILMRDAMHRGGPDDAGLYLDENLPLALGHRRLALIDLSPSGHQPMEGADGNLQIIFNGEIYNYLELKKELSALGHRFKTQSDTEVILKAWQQWGAGCFNRFNGMFALALWDRKQQQIILARDHAGIKPIYFNIAGNRLIFASEIRAFKALDPYWPETPDWKIPYLSFGFLPEPFTTLLGVEPLPKGSYAVINLPDCSIKITEFHRFAFSIIITSEAEALTAIKETMDAAVQRHLISDAPIGLFLSGGIDSSLLTLIAHKYMGNNLKTLSIVFEDATLSEAYYQKLIIDKTGANHHSFLVTEKEFEESLPDILKAMDQPSNDGINSYFISKYAHQNGLTAVLSGLGADELFGGYNSFGWAGRINMIRSFPSFALKLADRLPFEKYKKLSALQHKNITGDYLANRGFFSQRQVSALLDISEKQIVDCLKKVAVPDVSGIKDPLNRVSAWETNIYMQNQLLKDTDYMSMWHGLEVRVPFLDKEIMQLAHNISPEIKYKPGIGKHLLIGAFKDILPKEIWDRKKQGFMFPYNAWFKNIYLNSSDTTYRKIQEDFKQNKLHYSRYWCFITSMPKEQIRYNAKKPKNVLFVNLAAFSITGGMEKFNRCFMYALQSLEHEGKITADAISFCDTASNPVYFPEEQYKGFNRNRVQFVVSLLLRAKKYDAVILGHINLSIPGLLIKIIYGKQKQVLVITHGIEVWGILNKPAQLLLKKADQILAVSNFTKNKIIERNGIPGAKIHIFPNTFDPFFAFPTDFKKPLFLKERYGINPGQKVVLTLTRISSSEKYKGYDLVLETLPSIKKLFPGLKYIIAGKYDEQEKNRIDRLVTQYQLQDTVVIPGFIADDEITAHYLLADVFIMPSKKEGFGIVFIEAMACGLPVIAGNLDGSVDALQNGQLGTLINPDSKIAIADSLTAALNLSSHSNGGEKQELQTNAVAAFGFSSYLKNLDTILSGL